MRRRPGGIVHAYLKYDPTTFPSPTSEPPDLASAAMEHMLRYGSTRRLTDEELANAIRLDPSRIAGFGPSLESLIAMLEERKRRILETYETRSVRRIARRAVDDEASGLRPPDELAARFGRVVRGGQVRDLERLWYAAEGVDEGFASGLLRLRDRLGESYQIEALEGAYEFTGRTSMDVPTALAVKEELETIDRLLEQLREAMKNAQVALIDLDELSRFVDQADVESLEGMRRQVEDLLRQQAEMQGLERGPEGYALTPRAYKIYQGKLLQAIFSELEASRSGRHAGPVEGDGVVESPKTRPYAFGDAPSGMDTTQTIINAIASGRHGSGRVRVSMEDIEIHQTRNTPRCATAVLMDMSGSMRYFEQYIATKRMALAFDALIRSEYPGDVLEFIEIYSVAKRRRASEVSSLMPKPVTIRDPVVRLKADMSDERITEMHLPPHFTNIQHGLSLARQLLSAQETPNRQILLLTDGLPTAHFEGTDLMLLYPPDPLTERATLREAHACAREGITINVFLLPSWSQDEDDIAFAHRMAEGTSGRVFFTGGHDVDRFVLWDYVAHRRTIIG
ncbi:MAG: hypothetical protein KDA28_00980 [Phycisphaerales bacterium]|nr:hypothetical protein [Phycisphaerales bacterium]